MTKSARAWKMEKRWTLANSDRTSSCPAAQRHMTRTIGRKSFFRATLRWISVAHVGDARPSLWTT